MALPSVHRAPMVPTTTSFRFLAADGHRPALLLTATAHIHRPQTSV